MSRSNHTNVDVGLVTGECSIVSYTIHPLLCPLAAKCILNWVDAALVLRSAHKNSREARHGGCAIKNNSSNERTGGDASIAADGEVAAIVLEEWMHYFVSAKCC